MFNPFVFHIRWPQLDVFRTDYSSSAAHRDYFKRRSSLNRFVVFSLKNIVIQFVYFLSVGLSEKDGGRRCFYRKKKNRAINSLMAYEKQCEQIRKDNRMINVDWFGDGLTLLTMSGVMPVESDTVERRVSNRDASTVTTTSIDRLIVQMKRCEVKFGKREL